MISWTLMIILTMHWDSLWNFVLSRIRMNRISKYYTLLYASWFFLSWFLEFWILLFLWKFFKEYSLFLVLSIITVNIFFYNFMHPVIANMHDCMVLHIFSFSFENLTWITKLKLSKIFCKYSILMFNSKAELNKVFILKK